MALHAPEGYDCPFCAIVRGEERTGVATKRVDVVVRTDLLTAFVASHQWPNNPGHVLVIPNDHFENLYDLPAALAEPLQIAVQQIADAMKRAFDCPGISTRQHNEPAAGQDVWHYHVHVFPRFKHDHLLASTRRRASDVERSLQAERIRQALQVSEGSS